MKQTILLVEDHENDVFLIKRAFKKFDLSADLQVAEDGAIAIEYLSGANKYADRTLYPLPSLVLMDIKMPRVNGLEVLEWMKKQENVKMIPVVIISSSPLEEDINKAYQLGVNAYLVKPIQFDELEELFHLVSEFFTNRAAHPVLEHA